MTNMPPHPKQALKYTERFLPHETRCCVPGQSRKKLRSGLDQAK